MGNKCPDERSSLWKYIHVNEIRTYLGNDSNFKRMRFVRYADDLLIGVIGSHKDCKTIRDDLAKFLKESLSLELSLVKILITNSTKDKAHFLGFDIFITPYKKRQLVKSVRKIGSNRLTAQTSRPQLLAPISNIVAKLAASGYCREGMKGKPTRIGKLTYLTLPRIINHYLSVGRGLIHYFSCADNFTVFKARINYILKYSCALTFASKLSLRTLKKVFSKFGYDLSVKEMVKGKSEEVAIFKDETLTGIKPKFNLNIKDYDPLSILDLYSKTFPRTKTPFEGECYVCGSKDNLEVHHLKHLSKANDVTKKSDYTTNLMKRINRKQILLCVPCQNKVHQGKHFGPGL
jgi:hypothetical protein